MSQIFIGAKASAETATCHAFDDWERLLAAMASGDSEAILAVALSAKPKVVPTANLRRIEPPSMKDAADAYWAKRQKPSEDRFPTDANDPEGLPIVLKVRQ